MTGSIENKSSESEYLAAWEESHRLDIAAAERDDLLKRRSNGLLGRPDSARLVCAMREIDRINNFLTPPTKRNSIRWQRIAIHVLRTIQLDARKNRKWIGTITKAIEKRGYMISEQAIIRFLKKWGSVVPYGIKHGPCIEERWPRGDPKEERRREGFELLERGLSQAEVARKMGVSRKTVSIWAQKLKIGGGWNNRQRGRPRKLHYRLA